MNDGDGSDDGAGSKDLAVNPAQFAALFPFHVAFDDSLRITQLGSSHARLLPSFAVGQHLPSVLSLERPTTNFDFETVKRHCDTLFIGHRQDGLRFRGQMVLLGPTRGVFLCSPWLPDPGGLVRWGLTLDDFPLHDAIPELVQVVQSQRLAVNDLQRLTKQLRKQRAELGAAVEQAREANQAKTSFLTNVSHELRTPLNTILGMTSLLGDARLDAESAELVRTVSSSAEALLNTVGDLLDISKIEAGELTFASTTVDVTAVCEEALDIVRTHIAPDVLLALVAPPARLRVWGDPHRLRQLLVAIVRQALSATTLGSVALTVSWSIVDDDAMLSFAVRDTGVDLHHAERRWLVDLLESTTPAPRTTGQHGFGLDIARALVEALGGRIAVDSDVQAGIGCRCVVTLTLSAIDTAAVEGMEGNVLVVAEGAEAPLIVAACAGAGVTARIVPADQAVAASRLATAIICDRAATASACPPVAVPVIHLQRGMSRNEGVVHAARVIEGPLTPSAVRRALGNDERHSRPSSPTIQLGLRVLLIDDNPDGERYARMVLARSGCIVTSAATVDEALTALSKHVFEVVLMDINLPDGSGIDAVIAIRAAERIERRAQIPIIALTAHALRRYREDAFTAGVNDYITKPVRPATLVETVARAGGVDVAKVLAEALAPSSSKNEDDGDAEDDGVVEIDDDLLDLVEGYIASVRARVGEIEAAMADGRFEEIRRLGHSLRGTGSMYGFARLTELGGMLEDATRNEDGTAIDAPDVTTISTVAAMLTRWAARVQWRGSTASRQST